MKKAVVMSGCFLAVCIFLSGCHNTAAKNASVKGSGVDVVIEGGGQFPQFLAGKWKADKGGWEIVFAPDGTITSAVIAFGRETIYPGRVTKVKMLQRGKGIFEPGQWAVYYNPDSRELMVKIVFNHIRTEFGGGAVEGKNTDVISGQVFNDNKTWVAEWTSYPELVAHTSKYPNFNLTPPDANEDEGLQKGTLIFGKVTSGK